MWSIFISVSIAEWRRGWERSTVWGRLSPRVCTDASFHEWAVCVCFMFFSHKTRGALFPFNSAWHPLSLFSPCVFFFPPPLPSLIYFSDARPKEAVWVAAPSPASRSRQTHGPSLALTPPQQWKQGRSSSDGCFHVGKSGGTDLNGFNWGPVFLRWTLPNRHHLRWWWKSHK